MPLFNRAPGHSQFSSSPDLAETIVELGVDSSSEGLAESFPIQGEIIQSFEIADTPGGWHLIWLDQAVSHEGQTYAHLMIAARWVARPLTKGQTVPVNVRLVSDASLIQKGAPDIEKLPFATKAIASIL